jgi:hypothetical protein
MPLRRAGHGSSHRPQAALDLPTLSGCCLIETRVAWQALAELDITVSCNDPRAGVRTGATAFAPCQVCGEPHDMTRIRPDAHVSLTSPPLPPVRPRAARPVPALALCQLCQLRVGSMRPATTASPSLRIAQQLAMPPMEGSRRHGAGSRGGGMWLAMISG